MLIAVIIVIEQVKDSVYQAVNSSPLLLGELLFMNKLSL